MKTSYFLIIALILLLVLGRYVARNYASKAQPCEISGERMSFLRDSFLMDEMEKGAYSSFREPFVDSVLDSEAARRADSMYLHRLSQYD